MLKDKKILVGMSGGIAAFKAVGVVRELTRRGAEVRVAMTPSACRFIGPMTLTGLTGRAPVVDLWDPNYPGEIHVELGEWADAVVIAPATANLLARAASGFADDAVLATLSCARGAVLMAPAMHERMWNRQATQRNVARLAEDGVRFVGPVAGALASGEEGMGRMAEPHEIVEALIREAFVPHDLLGRTVLVSAGPTLEDIDPVRFISNRSSGRMGYALAAAARDRGATVVLVTGPTNLPLPSGVDAVHVRSAVEMRDAIDRLFSSVDAVVMTAAVADYRPAETKTSKIKKQGESMSIELVKNPDILSELGKKRSGKRPVLVGFAMETHDVIAYARKKLVEKRVDFVVANEARVGFGRDDTQASFVDREGDLDLAPMSKVELAHRIWDRVKALLGNDAARLRRNRPAPRPRVPRPARRRSGRSPSKA